MKALTIWQPWASLIACGVKKYETRSWPTKYRGPIAIHAAMKRPPKQGELEWDNFNAITKALAESYGAWRYDWHLGSPKINPDGSNNGFDIPLGYVVAIAEIVDCWLIKDSVFLPLGTKGTDYFIPTQQEQYFGDWTPGRYAWELANVKMLPEPIPAKGQQGLWNVSGCKTCRYNTNDFVCHPNCGGCNGVTNWRVKR